ncbi:MAG: DUF5362 family protein [Ginsengibacter sp.]
MSDDIQPDLLPDELEITQSFRIYLSDLSRWAKFLAVIGFMWCSLLFAGAFGVGYFINVTHSRLQSLSQTITALFVLFAVMWVYPCIYLNKFSNNISKALKENNQDVLEDGLQNLKSAFRLFGIVTGVILTLWLSIFIIFFSSGF